LKPFFIFFLDRLHSHFYNGNSFEGRGYPLNPAVRAGIALALVCVFQFGVVHGIEPPEHRLVLPPEHRVPAGSLIVNVNNPADKEQSLRDGRFQSVIASSWLIPAARSAGVVYVSLVESRP
jgi:hypothetical protein